MSSRHRRGPALVLATVAVVIAAIGLALNVRQVAAAFLVAYTAVTSVVLGVLATIMIALLTTATWFAALRSQAERVIRAMPALAVLSVLLLPAVFVLQPAVDTADQARRVYLKPAFLVARTVMYWIVWLAIAESLRATLRHQGAGAGDDSKAARHSRVVASAGLVALALTMTFASIDWMMALTPRWYSTIYAVYWFAGGMTGALGLLAILSRSDAQPRERDGAIQALGKLMLTFVMFWVYIGFAQYIVIWSANIPLEVTWYVERTHEAWGGVALALLIGAAISFLALVNRAVRRRGAIVAALGALLLVLRYVDAFWTVIPGVVPLTWWLIALSAATLVIVVDATMLVAAIRGRA